LPGNLWTISGGTLTIVDGSLTTTQNGRDVYFTVQNNTGSDVSITSIKAEFATTAWYERIIIGSTTVFSSTNPRGASGEIQTFSAIVIASEDQKEMRITRNKDTVSGTGSAVDMRGTTYLVTFSEGSIVAFVAGADD
jgi:hypothetical protein